MEVGPSVRPSVRPSVGPHDVISRRGEGRGCWIMSEAGHAMDCFAPGISYPFLFFLWFPCLFPWPVRRLKMSEFLGWIEVAIISNHGESKGGSHPAYQLRVCGHGEVQVFSCSVGMEWEAGNGRPGMGGWGIVSKISTFQTIVPDTKRFFWRFGFGFGDYRRAVSMT